MTTPTLEHKEWKRLKLLMLKLPFHTLNDQARAVERVEDLFGVTYEPGELARIRRAAEKEVQ